eukprot:3601816-Prymnesium_polylepis.1
MRSDARGWTAGRVRPCRRRSDCRDRKVCSVSLCATDEWRWPPCKRDRRLQKRAQGFSARRCR